MSVYNLLVRIGGNAKGLTDSLDGVVKDFKGAFGDVAKIAAGNLIATQIANLGSSLFEVGKSAIVMAGELEQTKVAFETMLGSAEKADAFLKDLADFAANTPFEMKGLQDSSKKLLAFGFQSQQIIPMMTAIGNAVGGLGGGAAEIDRVTMALGQMQAKGKVSAEEMMQLAELGIPAWDMLAKSIGVSVPEAMKLAEKGAIPAAAAIEGLIAGMNERFPNMMAKQSKTLLGAWSNLQDGISAVLVRVGTEFAQTFDVTGLLQKASAAVGGFAASIDKLGLGGALNNLFSPELKAIIIGVAGALTAAMVPAMVSAGTAISAAVVAAGPFIAAGAAIAGAAYVIIKNWDPIKGFFASLWSNLVSGVTAFAEGFKSRFGFIGQIVQAVAQFILEKFQWAFKLLPQGMQDAIKKAGDAVLGLPAMAMPALKQTSKAVADTFKGASQDAQTIAKGLVGGVSDELGKLPGKAAKPAKDTAKAIGEAIKPAELSFQGLYAAFQRIDTEAKYLGTGSIEVLRSKIGALESQIKDAIAFTGPMTAAQQVAFNAAVKDLEKYRKKLGEAEEAQKDLGKSAKSILGPMEAFKASTTDILTSVNGLREGLKTMAETLGIKVDDTVLVVASNLGNFALAGVQVWTSVSTLIPQLVSMGMAMHAALGPIGLVTAGLAALGAGAAILWRNFDKDGKEAAEKLRKTWLENVGKIRDSMESAFGSSVADSLKRFFNGEQVSLFEDLQKGVREAIINGMVQALVDGALLKGRMKDLMDQLAQAVANGNTALVNATIGQIRDRLPKLTADLNDAATKLKGVLDFNLPKLGNPASGAPDLSSFAPPIPEQPTIEIPTTLPDLSGTPLPDLRDLGPIAMPRLSTGGVVTGPTFAEIGEGADDEAVIPLNDATFERLGSAIANAMGNQGGGTPSTTIHVTIQAGTFVGDEAGLQQLARMIGIQLNNMRMQAI